MKYDDSTKIEFYVSMIANERWSVRTLNERMRSMLYERTSLSKLPEETIRNDIGQLKNEKKMSTEMFLRDPYVLDFSN